MTIDPSPLGPPLSICGAAVWFGRNFLEALIWASAGAAVLIVLLAAYHFPQIALLTCMAAFVVVGVAWTRFASRPTRRAHWYFRILGISIWVARGTHGDPQRDRP